MTRILFCLFIVFFTCSSIQKNLYGVYSKTWKDASQYTVELKSDSTFIFINKSIHAFSKCEGKWQAVLGDTLLLRCNDESLQAKLERGYMSEREFKVIVLSNSRLKLKEVILNKK